MTNKELRRRETDKFGPYVQQVALDHANKRISELEQERDQLRQRLDAADKQKPVGWSLIFFGDTKPNMTTSFESEEFANSYARGCAKPCSLLPKPRPAPIVVPLYSLPPTADKKGE